jgi:5-dehydro-2-deoxygluconokinase
MKRESNLKLDLLTMGRSCIDLYSSDIGSPFAEISGFDAFVGGCPTNTGTGAARLGLKTAVLTAIGPDPVGEFVLNFLSKEGVITDYVLTKPGRRTSAVILGIEPPDKFPLVYYRDNCADIELDIDDVLAAPISQCRTFFISGTGLCKEPSRSATMLAAELAGAAGVPVVLDLDFRPDQWHDLRAFGIVARSALRHVDVVIGSSEEVKAASLSDPSQVTVKDLQISDARVKGDLKAAIARLLAEGAEAVVVKKGTEGSTVHLKDGQEIDAPPFPVEVLNILGAGDAYAAGFIYARLQGWDWYRAARMGNACGAIVVTRSGCANFMPYETEALEFISQRGGF